MKKQIGVEVTFSGGAIKKILGVNWYDCGDVWTHIGISSEDSKTANGTHAYKTENLMSLIDIYDEVD
jgi:hypothetical protein